MNYKYIFFDFDGTLVNTVKGTAESAQYALNQLSIKTDNIENLGKIFCGPPLKESFSKFLTKENDIKSAIELYKKYQAENTIELSEIYDGIKELLERLKDKGKTLNVVTLKSKETTIKIFRHLPIF